MATDSYRLALRDIDGSDAFGRDVRRSWFRPGHWPSCSGCSPRARAPRDGRPRGRRTSDRRSGFSVGDHDATFTAGDVKVSTRLLDGKYPRLPPAHPGRVSEPAPRRQGSLLDALRRVRLLVRDNTTPVRLSMRPGGVELTVVSQEVGHASETVDADFEGEELTIAFNPTYLIDGVEAVFGDEVCSRRWTPPSRRRCGPRRRRLPVPPHARARVLTDAGRQELRVVVSLAVTDFRNFGRR